MILFYLVLNTDQISNQNWYFFPEKEYIFNRVFEQKSFSKTMIPSNKTVLCCEVTCDPSDDIWQNSNDKKTFQKVITQLEECKIIKKDQMVDTFTKRIERAYPIYFTGFRQTLDEIFNKLDSVSNLYSIGRQGGYNYVGMIDCYDIGQKTAQYIIGNSNYKNKKELRNSFFNYIVID